MRFPFRASRALVAAALAWSGAVPCGRADDAVAVVARVGEATITRPQFDAAARRANVMALPEGPPRDQGQAAVLEQLVNEALLRKAASREAIVADPQAVEAAVEQLRGQVAARGGDFAAALAQMGRDEAGLREQIGSELLLREFLGRRITKQAIETFFEQRHREFDGTLVRVSHVVLRPDLGRGPTAVEECVARAGAIREQILLGATTIGEAARAHSAGPSRRRDGDVGFLPRHGAADEAFAKQAFALAKGEISKPFVTPFGVHLIQITAVEPGMRSLGALRPQIERAMAEEIVRATLAQERQQAKITYENGVPHFDPATPADGSVPRRVVVGGAVGSP